MAQLTATALGLIPPKEPDEAEGELAGCRLRLKLDSQVVAWQEDLTGTLFLEGGDRPCTVSVEVKLAAYPGEWSTCGSAPPRSWKEIEIRPQERIRVCFELRMPRGVAFQPVQCRAVIRSGRRHATTLTTGITVAPPECYRRLALLLAEVLGARLLTWKMDYLNDAVSASFSSEETPSRPFDRLDLVLRRSNGLVHGCLIYWQSSSEAPDDCVNAGRYVFDVPETEPHPARSFYETSLSDYQGRLCKLPIPAVAPQSSAEQLPRPAHRPGQTEEAPEV